MVVNLKVIGTQQKIGNLPFLFFYKNFFKEKKKHPLFLIKIAALPFE